METADGTPPSAVDREALQLIAEGVTELAGFELAAISVVHEGRLHTVAVAGSERAAVELSTMQPSVATLLSELEHADEWGLLRFVPEHRANGLTDYSYIPELTPLERSDAWQPRDLLVALLEDDAGRLRGVLSVDVPRDGLRPDPDQRRAIEQYARRAGRALVYLLERQELQDEMHRERATSDYRGQLIEALSHQLQNPVAAISGNLELLLDDLEHGDPRERSLRAIERATGRIQAMVTDLLSLAKVNSPTRPLHEVPVDLGVLVGDVVESVASSAAAAEVKVLLDPPDSSLDVVGDPGELEDLTGNLLSNAIKYSEPGGTVRVTVGSVVEGLDTYAELSVSDEGIGIAVGERGRLFEEFYRSDRIEVRRRPGTGLGLSVVDRVVRRHHGRIEVESELGEGTTFRVLLPAAD